MPLSPDLGQGLSSLYLSPGRSSPFPFCKDQKLCPLPAGLELVGLRQVGVAML